MAEINQVALLISPRDLILLGDYDPEFTIAQKRSWLFEAGRIDTPRDESVVIGDIENHLGEVNHSLTFDVFTEETSALLAEFRGMKNSWRYHRGRLYHSLNISALELFLASFHSSFFIPKMIVAREDADEELAFSKPADPDTKTSNALFIIDYDGPLLSLSDGTFLIPPYQVFSIQVIELKDGVVHIQLHQKDELREQFVPLSDDMITWIEKKGKIAHTKESAGKFIYYQFTVLHRSYDRLVSQPR